MKRKPSYYVLTYDVDLEKFTPQVGVRCGPYTLWGLKRALRKLQELGYPCDRGDCSVLVYRHYTDGELLGAVDDGDGEAEADGEALADGEDDGAKLPLGQQCVA